MRDDLTNLPEITDVELVATRDYEISIELSERDMRRHGLAFDDVVAAVRRSSLDLPGGSIRTRERRDPAAHPGPGLPRAATSRDSP